MEKQEQLLPEVAGDGRDLDSLMTCFYLPCLGDICDQCLSFLRMWRGEASKKAAERSKVEDTYISYFEFVMFCYCQIDSLIQQTNL